MNVIIEGSGFHSKMANLPYRLWFVMSLLTLLLFTLVRTEQYYACPNSCSCLRTHVDCSKLGLVEVPQDLPYWVENLNLNGNRVAHLAKGSLDNFTSLTELQLNRNRLRKFPKELFKELKHLRVLELNRNQFTEIEGLSFKGLESLTTLKLKHNLILKLLDGAFYELKNMNVLQLDHNNVSAVTKGWLYGLSSLQQLSLSHNQVSRVELDGWEFCSELVELDLSYNQLQAIEKGTFEHLPKLQRLILNGNRISYIAEGAFNSTPSLRMLDLNHNEISWTIEDMTGAFMSLSHLSKLGLASNLIKSINKKSFMGLSGLKRLDLSNNNITSVQENAFGSMRLLEGLHLNSSFLLCDCNLKWFPAWLARSGFLGSVGARCAHPQWLHGSLVSEVPTANFTCDDFPKPVILEEPKQQVRLKGENLTLTCQATSTSSAAMRFQWKKDNVDLQTPGVHKFSRSMDDKVSEHTSELTLFNISHSEAGKYQCVVSNMYGTTYSQKSKISVLVFPSFTKTPGNVTLKSGSTAKLECAAEGEPKPQIAWHKDGGNDFPAARERRMHVIPADVIFFIVNVKPSDMGVYSCTAQNEAGKIIANATLTVLEIPTFVKPMENKEISVGDSTVLECMAAGSPKPKLTWTKDGSPLIETTRHFFTAESQLLIIVNAALSDAGNYQCEMSNTLGTERGSARLTIIPPSIVASTNDAVVTGYILISVVCCAVVTSVCWVFIIYQTRKPTNASSSLRPSPELGVDGEEPVQAASLLLLPSGDTSKALSSSQLFLDTESEHSSGKDSGTGDSAKSSDDLVQTQPQAFPLDNRLADGSKCNATKAPTLDTFHPQLSSHEQCRILAMAAASVVASKDELRPCIPGGSTA